MAGTLRDILSGDFRRRRGSMGQEPALRRPGAVAVEQPPPVRRSIGPRDIDAMNAATLRRKRELDAQRKKRKKKPTLSDIEAQIRALEAQLGQ